jgi:serine/threonine protein kinase
MSFVPGQTVGAYRIVEQLGCGGMATVYKAYHAALDRYVALKVIHPAFRGDATFLARFQREARVVARLEHPNIVPVYDFSEHDGAPYLVMRFVPGTTLKARLKETTLSIPEIMDIVRPMAHALAYAHDQGVLHRDIKPSNVLLCEDGRVYLTDFGLARIIQSGESSLTRDSLVGTPHYISPEQAMGKSELDARTDVYSFGVVLYELLTGRVPFQADTPFAVIHDHIYTPLPLPRSVNAGLSVSWERVLLKALAKDPQDRYATPMELLAAAESCVATVAGSPAADTPVPAYAPPETLSLPAAETLSLPQEQPQVDAAGQSSADPAPRARFGNSWRRFAALGIVVLVLVAGIVAVAVGLPGRTTQELPQSTAAAGLAQASNDEPLPPEPGVDQLLAQAEERARQGDPEAAAALLERASLRDPHDVGIYVEGARILSEFGFFPAAVDLLAIGVENNPEELILHLFLGRGLVGVDDWEAAMRELNWVLERDPDLAEPHAYVSVHLAINVGDLAGAEEEANQALRLDPDSPEAHFAMAVFHWRAGHPRLARQELERAQEARDVSPVLRERISGLLQRLEP